MKILITLLFLFHALYAYSVDDTIDKSVSKRLSLKPDTLYIIDFFASWCSSCEKELPELNHFNSTLDYKKYEIIGIDVDKDETNARSFQADLGITFRVINDSNQAIISEFKPLGMPTLYIVKNAKVLHIISGARDDIDEELNTYLKGIDAK